MKDDRAVDMMIYMLGGISVVLSLGMWLGILFLWF